MSEHTNEIYEAIDEDTVNVFIWSVWNFFSKTTGIEPEVGTPYFFDEFENSDYTGIIGISGSQKGIVYITLCRSLMKTILQYQYPHHDVTELDESRLEGFLSDCAGEVANIVTGNARNYFGENFLISTPAVTSNANTSIKLEENNHGIVLPIKWKEYRCHLILSVKKPDREGDQNSRGLFASHHQMP